MSLTAAHLRTRERFMALYEICLGKSATQVAKDSERNPLSRNGLGTSI